MNCESKILPFLLTSASIFLASIAEARCATVWQNGGPLGWANALNISSFATADDFLITTPTVITDLDVTIAYLPSYYSGTLGWAIYQDSAGRPDGSMAAIATGSAATNVTPSLGMASWGGDVYEVSTLFGTGGVFLNPGVYWLALREGAWGSPWDGTSVYWAAGPLTPNFLLSPMAGDGNHTNPTTWPRRYTLAANAFFTISTTIPVPEPSRTFIIFISMFIIASKRRR